MNRLISIAPMLKYTDRHFRYFLRLISHHALLYTEMIPVGAVLRDPNHHSFAFDPIEHPIAAQVGGSDPKQLQQCAKIIEEHGYDEINLNVGCPSERVHAGRFGASLMMEPTLVAECIAAMQHLVDIPVTVKTRIGIDENDTYDFLYQFIDIVSKAGCNTFILHARKAWLKGLSPKQNRTVPPLRYDLVQQIKKDFPHLDIIMNGGIQTFSDIKAHLKNVDGVMIGRSAYHNPYFLSSIDQTFYDDDHQVLSRKEILKRYIPYIEREVEAGTSLSCITRHIHGLFHGVPGVKAWRRRLSESQAPSEILF